MCRKHQVYFNLFLTYAAKSFLLKLYVQTCTCERPFKETAGNPLSELSKKSIYCTLLTIIFTFPPNVNVRTHVHTRVNSVPLLFLLFFCLNFSLPFSLLPVQSRTVLCKAFLLSFADYYSQKFSKHLL